MPVVKKERCQTICDEQPRFAIGGGSISRMSLSAEEMDTLREAVAALDTQVAERVIAKLQQLEEAKLKELVSAPDALSELVGAIARKTQDAMAKEAKKARKAKLKEDDGLKLASSSSDHTTRAATCLPGPTDISESSRATHLPAVPPKLVPRHSRTLNINVGVLGHVDSGKTSLTRALSTVGSTASFDKHPQSKERGITLDLGFSSFSMGMPDHLRDEPYVSSQLPSPCPSLAPPQHLSSVPFHQIRSNADHARRLPRP